MKNKKIGLAVCCPDSYREYKNIKFDFYKLLSIAINNYQLIDMISKHNKFFLYRLGKEQIKILRIVLEDFQKKNLKLIYTSMSHDPKDINLKRIVALKKKFKLPVGMVIITKIIFQYIFQELLEQNIYLSILKKINKKGVFILTTCMQLKLKILLVLKINLMK